MALRSCATAVVCRARSDRAVSSTNSAWRRSVRGATPPSRRMRVSSTDRPALSAVSRAMASSSRSAASVAQALARSPTRVRRTDRAADSVARYWFQGRVVQRAQPAEQVDLERGRPDIGGIEGVEARSPSPSARGAAAGGRVGPRRCPAGRTAPHRSPRLRKAAARRHVGHQIGPLDAVLRARRTDVGDRDAKIPVVRQGFRDQPLQAGIAEDVGVGQRRQRRLARQQRRVARGPSGRDGGHGALVSGLQRGAPGQQQRQRRRPPHAVASAGRPRRPQRSFTASSPSRTPRRTSTKNSGI